VTATLHGERTAREIARESRRLHYAPPPSLTLSEWADAYRMLSSESASEPGRWRTDRFEPMREIMDAMSDPTVERVSVMKPAQIGWTELIGNLVGYVMDQEPGPLLVVQPTVDLAKMWSKERFDPMLRDTGRLHGMVTETARREKDQTILRKTFPGGFMAITGANAAAGLRSRPVRHLIGDERDAWPLSSKGSAKVDSKTGATGEGDPWLLGVKRTTTFWNRKLVEGSTPTVRGFSAIERSYEQGSQAQYHVACPHCGHEQTLRWSNLEWEKGRPETAQYRCGDVSKDGEVTSGCGLMIPHSMKGGLVRRGQWVHACPDRTRHRSFWINALYSPWLSWSELVGEWIAAYGKPEELKVFVNTRLAETWEDAGERMSEDALQARAEQYEAEVPAGVVVITIGVDLQGDRLEYVVVGWGAGEESWRLDYGQLWGSPEKAEVWTQLDAVRSRTWKHALGGTLAVRAVAIDTGFHTTEVYRYCKARPGQGVFPVKGVGDPGKAPVNRPAMRSPHRLWLLGTIALKDTLFARMTVTTAGPGYMHFPKWLPPEYYRQLTSERRVTAYIAGRSHRKYLEIPGRRNEVLDCEQYALAALYMLGPVKDQLGTLADQMRADATKRDTPPPEAPDAGARFEQKPPPPPPTAWGGSAVNPITGLPVRGWGR
jgi:phage terminase large subunit GpA-like protein